MDRKTNNILGRISRGIPKHLARNTTREIVDVSEEVLARAALRDPGISRTKKNKIAKLLEAGAFRRRETVVNETVVSQIDKYNTREVKRAIATGRIPDPMTDPFYRKRMERLARGDFKKADPLTRKEIINARKLLGYKK